jgi:hypothetical protein
VLRGGRWDSEGRVYKVLSVWCIVTSISITTLSITVLINLTR